MTPTLRAATTDDIAAVLLLWREAEAPPTHTDDADGLAALVAHDPGALIVADGGGRIVGSVIAGWDGWRGSIYRIVVAPAHRRQGLARRLLAAAEDRLRSAGARRCQAIVDEADARATAFWAASGWDHQPERLRFVKG